MLLGFDGAEAGIQLEMSPGSPMLFMMSDTCETSTAEKRAIDLVMEPEAPSAKYLKLLLCSKAVVDRRQDMMWI